MITLLEINSYDNIRVNSEREREREREDHYSPNSPLWCHIPVSI